MTVPTLMANYQKHTYVVGLKKAYATLTNAMKMLPISRGCPSGDYECALFFNNDDVTEIDGHDVSTLSAGQIAIYLLSTQIKHKKVCYGGDCFDGKYNPLKTAYHSTPAIIIADDGIIYGTHYAENNYIGVDINGTKGPNKIGRDIFYFTIATETRNNVPAGTIMPHGSELERNYNHYAGAPDGGYGKDSCTTANVNKPLADNAINTFGVGDYGCTARVLEEGAMNY